MIKTYTRLGWREDLTDANQIDLQTKAIRLMCRFGYDECVNKANELYTKWAISNIE